MNTKTILDLDAMLDMDVDAIETKPDYVTPPKGVYTLKIVSAGIKSDEDKDGKPRNRIVIENAIVETHESEEPPFPSGSMFSERFTPTEDGLSYFKKQAMKILNVDNMEGAKVRDIFEALANTEYKAAITLRKSKGDNGQEYTNVNVRPLHDTTAS